MPSLLPSCIHCEAAAPEAPSLLCVRCLSFSGIRRLYLRRRGWTQRWEKHLLALTHRARQQLPLFPF